MVEADAEIAGVGYGRAIGKVYIADHKPLLVSLVSVASHGYPCKMLSVFAPYRVGIITASIGYLNCLSTQDVIYVYVGVGAECVLLAGFLAA